MTDALKLIRQQVVEAKATEFTVPAQLLNECDLELVERGVLTFSGKHKSHAHCPECGKLVDIDVSCDKFGEVRYSLLCPYCEVWEDHILDPQHVEILDFNYRPLLQFIYDENAFGDYVNEVAKCLPVDAASFKPKKKTPREKAPRDTPRFIHTTGRFEYTDNVHDIRLIDPNHRWAKFMPYYDLAKPTAAHEAIVAVLKGYKNKCSEGWVKADDSWHSAFLYRYPSVHRFKAQQIEVGKRTKGRNGEWRIVPDEEIDERYRRWNKYT